MNERIIMHKFIAGLLFFLMSSVRCVDIQLTTKTDIQILKLHFLLALRANCQRTENGEFKGPLCKTIQVVIQQCDTLLSRGTMNFAEVLIPLLSAISEELQDIKEVVRGMNQDFKIQKDANEDKELLNLIDILERKLKCSPEQADVDEIQARFNIIFERYNTRLNNK